MVLRAVIQHEPLSFGSDENFIEKEVEGVEPSLSINYFKLLLNCESAWNSKTKNFLDSLHCLVLSCESLFSVKKIICSYFFSFYLLSFGWGGCNGHPSSFG